MTYALFLSHRRIHESSVDEGQLKCAAETNGHTHLQYHCAVLLIEHCTDMAVVAR